MCKLGDKIVVSHNKTSMVSAPSHFVVVRSVVHVLSVYFYFTTRQFVIAMNVDIKATNLL